MFWNLFNLGLYEIVSYKSHGALIAGTTVFAILAFAIPYLLGSINTAVLISRVFYGDDVRHHGSGNAGLTNTLRTYGKKAALFVLLGDILKTVLSVFVGGLFGGLHFMGGYALGWGGFLGAVGCILGHVFPVYYKFKGGKGVLCAATSILALSPIVFCVLLLVFVIVVGFTKFVSLGSIMGALTYPLFFNILFKISFSAKPVAAPFYVTLYTVFVAFFIVYLHRANIQRLMKGEESKLSFKK
ncbi:MAG: glycerol-3-phosphate 1-O-acyltransferase PlsY [Clostridia bacterium]|nr:glycerol-3-phosphate 1-O-acyltransferase PlsY [Clostridia bacterium]